MASVWKVPLYASGAERRLDDYVTDEPSRARSGLAPAVIVDFGRLASMRIDRPHLRGIGEERARKPVVRMNVVERIAFPARYDVSRFRRCPLPRARFGRLSSCALAPVYEQAFAVSR